MTTNLKVLDFAQRIGQREALDSLDQLFVWVLLENAVKQHRVVGIVRLLAQPNGALREEQAHMVN